jgi:hypothetical protein
MIIEILEVVVLFLWFLTLIPYPALAPYTAGRSFLAFTAVLLLALFIFLPGLRG